MKALHDETVNIQGLNIEMPEWITGISFCGIGVKVYEDKYLPADSIIYMLGDKIVKIVSCNNVNM